MFGSGSEEPLSPKLYFSATDLASAGVQIDGNDIRQITRAAWTDIEARKHYGLKSTLSLSDRDLAAYLNLRNTVDPAERLGWKLSCLTSADDQYAAVKIVGANALNRLSGLPRSHSTVLLFDKLTMAPLCILEGTEISAARTATYPLIVLEKFFKGERGLSVFLFGAGPVAAKIVAALGSLEPDKIARVLVRSRTGESARAFAGRTAKTALFHVQAVDDNRQLRECQLVITASNAAGPVFDANEIGQSATVINLGGDETPPLHIERMVRQGRVLCDSIELVSRRNSQSLPLYFARKGASLEHLGPLLGIQELADVSEERPDAVTRPVHITCVGLPILDLHAAVHTYQRLVKSPGTLSHELGAAASATETRSCM